jgi:hypothetical protein
VVLISPNRTTLSTALVEETLENGDDVVVHCRESYHRAPAVLAAYMLRLCGIPYKVETMFVLPWFLFGHGYPDILYLNLECT